MSRATPDDQLKFLLNCVKHSNNGKIDFIEVAKECGIVSKGAAAKRYERLMKANGIHPNGGPSTQPVITAPATTKSSKAAIAKSAAAKRRKIEGDFRSDLDDVQPKRSPKIEPKMESLDHQRIKAEPMTGSVPPAGNFFMSSNAIDPPQLKPEPHTDPEPELLQPHEQQQQFNFEDSNSLFEDFCTPELFEPQTFQNISTTPADQPRFMPQPLTAMEGCMQIPRDGPVAATGNGPEESIVIAD